MTVQNKLSVVVSAFNEEKKIGKCLESIEWADEIIFVDNQSTDNTVQIAKKYTNKIFTQKNDPFNIDIQKNLGIEKATGDWILVLDSDEVISEELKEEIKIIIKNSHEPRATSHESIVGYQIPRKNIIFGKWIRHSGWYPDYQLRLFSRSSGKYEKKHVHEPLSIQGNIARLNSHIIHYNYDTVSQFLYKHLQIYAPNEAEELMRKGYVFDWKGAIRMPMSEFLSRYFAREGYKDGFHGLILAFLMGFYHFAIFTYLWERKKFTEVADEDMVSGLNEELKKSKKEFNYWINTREINEEKNSFRKISLKIKNKIKF